MQIFLIGFMGVGKTSIGKQLANKMGLCFYDLDAEIERKENLSISEIFRLYGEKKFRDIESDLLLHWDKPGIISCGGGIIEIDVNRDYLKHKNTIFLQADFEIIWGRVKHSDRPLIKNNTKIDVYNLYNKRERYYSESSTITIFLNSLVLHKNLDLVMRKIESKKNIIV